MDMTLHPPAAYIDRNSCLISTEGASIKMSSISFTTGQIKGEGAEKKMSGKKGITKGRWQGTGRRLTAETVLGFQMPELGPPHVRV